MNAKKSKDSLKFFIDYCYDKIFIINLLFSSDNWLQLVLFWFSEFFLLTSLHCQYCSKSLSHCPFISSVTYILLNLYEERYIISCIFDWKRRGLQSKIKLKTYILSIKALLVKHIMCSEQGLKNLENLWIWIHLLKYY